jgi:hypothetical protein
LSHGQASYVLERILADHRISRADVARYVSEMHHEIERLEERLQSLRAATGNAIARVIHPRRGRPPASAAIAAEKGQASAAPVKRRRRRAAITPEQLASRQLQGRYLGLIRQIPATRRAQYQRTAKERGREAAIREMMVTLKK